MGLDNDTVSVHSSAPVAVSPHPRDTRTYIYRAGVYGECSATCDGGMQYRSVDCWVQDPSNPHVVDESYCITQRLQRPQSQQACNMHLCAAAKFSVSSFSVVCISQCGPLIGVIEARIKLMLYFLCQSWTFTYSVLKKKRFNKQKPEKCGVHLH